MTIYSNNTDSSVNEITNIINKYDKDFTKNPNWFTLLTRPARNYLVFCKEVDGVERVLNFTNKFITEYKVSYHKQLKIYEGDQLRVIWNFVTIKSRGRVGYMISSHADALGVQVSEETFNTVYEMIMERVKKSKDARVEEADL